MFIEKNGIIDQIWAKYNSTFKVHWNNKCKEFITTKNRHHRPIFGTLNNKM